MSEKKISISGLLPIGGGLHEATVEIENGTISRISEKRDPGADLAADGILAPGLIDLQVNGAYGFDFTVQPSSVAAVAARLPETGVTSFLPTVITSEFSSYPARIQEIREAMQAAVPGQAQILGVHLEGPYMNPLRKGAHPQECIRKIDVAEIRAWADPAVTRIVTLAPELDGALEAVRALRENGIVVSAGHSDATYDQALAGFAAGMTWGTHLYNAMRPLQHREPGLMGALLTGETPCGMIVDGIHSHPAMVKLAVRSKGAGGICLITDSMAAMGMPAGRYQLGEYAVIVDETSARLQNGTLAGSILQMNEAVRNVMTFSGCSLPDALQMGSTNPARLLGLSRKGTLAVGQDADLVVLSADCQVLYTLIGGQIAYRRA
jgi:N-acetylglucosamine-6-phosphate deacetylase